MGADYKRWKRAMKYQREQWPVGLKAESLTQEQLVAHCWTPCEHFDKCIGYCPFCTANFIAFKQQESKEAVILDAVVQTGLVKSEGSA